MTKPQAPTSNLVKTSKVAANLPNTGEETDYLVTVFGVALASLGFVTHKRRRNEDSIE